MIAPLLAWAHSSPMSCHKETKLVAIVDDDDSVRGTLQELLRSAGFPSRAFESAESCFGSGDKKFGAGSI
jgi:FixJ family two-component response regulator